MLWCGLFFSNETNEGLTCNITLDIHKTDALIALCFSIF